VNGYQDTVVGRQYGRFYKNSFRQMSVFLGAWADLEVENWKDATYQCDNTCPPMDGCKCYDDYCAGSEQTGGQAVRCEQPSACNNCQTIVRAISPKCGVSAACLSPDQCVRGRKLTDLLPGCWLTIDFDRPWDITTGAWVTGSANPHKAGTLLFRYSNGAGIPLSIQIQDMIRGLPIPGTGFAPTANWDDYAQNHIYPIYPGRTTFTGGVPGIQLAIAGDPASPVFPHLDYAQIYVGPPIGGKARELYWDETEQQVLSGQTACWSVPVDPSTDFSTAGDVRVMPILPPGATADLVYSISHLKQSEPQLAASASFAPWSETTSLFQQDKPTDGNWDVCVTNNGDDVVLGGMRLELIQK
jgi:hypothetical protein